MGDEEVSPLVNESGSPIPRLAGSPSIGSRSRQAVMERRKARAGTPPRARRHSERKDETGQTQPDQTTASPQQSPRPLPALEELASRRAAAPGRDKARARRLSPTPPEVAPVAADNVPQSAAAPEQSAKLSDQMIKASRVPQSSATPEQSAKVSDQMIKASINRVPTIPPAAKARADQLVHVLRQHLKWVSNPPTAHRVLFQEGDESNGVMFFIAQGTLEVLEGNEVKALLEAGRSLGEVCIGNPDYSQRSATIRAQSDGLELLTLDTEAFRQALHSVQATFVGRGGPVEHEEPLRDDEWDWCLSFGCEPGQRKQPGSTFNLQASIGGETPPQPVTLQLPCEWNQWPRDGFTLPDDCVFTGTGTLSLDSDNWCELKGDGTRFLTELRSKDLVIVRLNDAENSVGVDADENAFAHVFTVHAVLDNGRVQITRPVMPDLKVTRAEYQVCRPVDAWGKIEWKEQGDWEALTFAERSRRRMAGAMNTSVDVQLLDDDPFYRLLDTYMHRPWLCPVHTLKLAFLKAGLEVRERISNQYDVLFLMVRARDEVLERVADASQVNAEQGMDASGCFLRNLVFDMELQDDDSIDKHDTHAVSTRPDETGGNRGGRWGHILGMSQYDSHLKGKFEDRRLNSRRFRRDRSVFKSDKRFPHPRYFNSGERQVLIKLLMESVEWARYVPHRRLQSGLDGSGDDTNEIDETLSYSIYSNVQIAETDGVPAAKAESAQLQGQKTFALCDSVAFGAPVTAGSSSLSRRSLESPLWTTLRDSQHTPLHKVLPAYQEKDEDVGADADDTITTKSVLPSITNTVVNEWRYQMQERHELMTYPFNTTEVQKIDKTQRRDRRQDFDADAGNSAPAYRKGLHVHKLPQGLELFVLERDTTGDHSDMYYMHYLHGGQTFKDFHAKVHRDHGDVASRLEFYRTESIREEMTFLLDCQPLHCRYEHEFLQSVWADWRNMFSKDCLNLPLNHIEGYFGSEVAFYYAWIQCYTTMLIYPAAFGLILQLIVWWPPTPFPGSVTKLRGWVAAYCLFVSLWSSMFVVKWRRTQCELQHRWGLAQEAHSESLRKEWLDRAVPPNEVSDADSVPLTMTDKVKQKLEYRDYAHVKPSATGSSLDSARYSSKGMHAARLFCSCLLVMVSACVVILFSLSALVVRTRGTNTIVGSVAAWTAVEFQDVSIEFWTIYEDQCEGLIPTPCDEKTWADNANNCGECKVLVANFATKYGGLCENFCRAQGLGCEGIWDEVDDTCEVKPDSEIVGSPLSCSVPYLDSSDAICECTPPAGGQAVVAGTCDKPDDFQPETAVYGFPPTSNSTESGGGIQYGWRHSERAVVRSPALCDEQHVDCNVETLDAHDVLGQSELLQSVPAAQLVVPLMLNVDSPHTSLPLRVPVYEPSCSELGTWVNISIALGQESIEGGVAVGLLHQQFGVPSGTLVENEESLQRSATGTVRKAEWSIANIDVVTSMFLFVDSAPYSADAGVGTTSDTEGCTIQMNGTISAPTSPPTGGRATYFRAPDPPLGQLLVYASTALSVAFIGLFGIAWKSVSRWMNDWENHRTRHEYEDAYVFKQYVFQFINFYFMLVYIAYLKQGTPMLSYNIEQHFGWEFDSTLKQNVLRLEDDNIPTVEMKETCISNPDSDSSDPDCMYELFSQLFFLFVGKQFALEAWENIAPKLTQKATRVLLGKNTPGIKHASGQPSDSKIEVGAIDDRSKDMSVQQCYEEFTMPRFGDKDINGCLGDYNEMMIQFGFMTLFASAFPGGAFFALLNNIHEMRSDGDALLTDFQRPPISRRSDIGAWGSVMSTISFLAVLSNSFIIGFTSAAAFELLVDVDGESSSIEERYTRYELWAAVIVAEHIMLLGKLLIESSFSATPNRVKRAKVELHHHENLLRDEKVAKIARMAGAAR